MNDAEKAGAWQRLWATGAEDSFGQSMGEPPASAHWTRWFADLPQGASVLDLACGSGALLRRFLASNQDAQAHCHGVDLVPESPTWLGTLRPAQRDRVDFTGSVSVTRLPFDDACFDAVVSQFGIEYADLSLAIPEAVRVLRPSGRLGLLMHHQASRPVALARVELEHAAWLQNSGWLRAAFQMCTAMALTSHIAGRQELNSSPDWARVRYDYDSLTRQVQSRAAASSCPDLLWDAQNWMTQAFRVSATEGLRRDSALLKRLLN
ncbi:class I SAM-dependent methyltransferase [Ideonella paludis]|uniref:class I SAM-dependent methyltransferase n=1 Tax=Ideonella paludis TaxID=1233411 RepID=UPI003624FEC6